MKFFILLGVITLRCYVTNGLPQFQLPFSQFSDFAMPDMPDFDKNFQMPAEADLRMSLPSIDSKKTNKTTSKKKLKGIFT